MKDKIADLAKKWRNRNNESWLGGGDHLSVNHLPRSTLYFRFFCCESLESACNAGRRHVKI